MWMCLSLLNYRGQEQDRQGWESGDKHIGNGGLGYRKHTHCEFYNQENVLIINTAVVLP